MEINHGLDPNPKLAGGLPAPSHQAHVVSARKGVASTCRFHSPPSFERTDASGDDSVARRRTPLRNSLDDEQWSDNLSTIVTLAVRKSGMWGSANLSLTEDAQEDFRNVVSGNP